MDARRLPRQRLAASTPLLAKNVRDSRTGQTDLPISSLIDTDAAEIGILIVAGLVGVLLLDSFSSAIPIANIVLPIGIILAMAWGNYRMTARSVTVILTPYFVMRTAIIFYAGLGALVPIFGNESTRDTIQQFFSFSQNDLLKYNFINVLFCLVFAIYPVIISRIFTIRSRHQHGSSFGLDPSALSMGSIGLIFLVVGEILRLTITLPTSFGLIQQTASVIVGQVALAENVGIFLCYVAASRKNQKYVPAVVIFTIWVMLTGLLTFSKTEVILPLIMLMLGVTYARPTIKNIIVSAVAIFLVFYSLQPMVTYGRQNTILCCGDIEAPLSPGERFTILRSYFTADSNSNSDENDTDYALARFSYVNAGTFLISQYDAGQVGNSFENAYVVFIPRFIWPDKPITTDVGRELGFAINGNALSSVAPGITPEAYWNGGWLGVIGLAIIVGSILWAWSMYSLYVQQIGSWHLFLIVLIGIRVGIRFDGVFVNDFLASILFGVIGHAIIAVLNKFLLQRSGV